MINHVVTVYLELAHFALPTTYTWFILTHMNVIAGMPHHRVGCFKRHFECLPCGSTMTCLCARCASLPFSFLPKRRPMEDLMPFFLGCLWRESWLLATLLSALASASREATILRMQTCKDNTKKFQMHFKFTNSF